MNFLALGGNFISCWIRIRIRNADPGDKSNADPCGSGSETLIVSKRKLVMLILRIVVNEYGTSLSDPSVKNKLKICGGARTASSTQEIRQCLSVNPCMVFICSGGKYS